MTSVSRIKSLGWSMDAMVISKKMVLTPSSGDGGTSMSMGSVRSPASSASACAVKRAVKWAVDN